MQKDLASAGAEISVVGNGNPDQARDFIARSGMKARVYCDEKRESYRLLGMKRGFLRTFGPRSAWYVLGALAKGYFPKAPQGDSTQQGGALVVTREGKIAYQHNNEVAGEPMRVAEILEAARRVAPAPA